MSDPKFHTKSGRLTRYALACGGVEEREKSGFRRVLWMEHSMFHVRENAPDYSHVFWETFETLTEARRKFDSKFPSNPKPGEQGWLSLD